MNYSDEYDALQVGEMLAKKISGELSPEEATLLDRWLKQSPEYNRTAEELLRMHEDRVTNSAQTIHKYDVPTALQLVMHRHRLKKEVRFKNSRFVRYAAVTIGLLMSFGLSLYLYHSMDPYEADYSVIDVSPGGNKASLTLSDGRVINLDTEQTGIIVGEDIRYNDGSGLALEDAATFLGTETGDLVLTTPRGGQYQVTLPDGSKVWLNSASTLIYPSRFDDHE